MARIAVSTAILSLFCSTVSVAETFGQTNDHFASGELRRLPPIMIEPHQQNVAVRKSFHATNLAEQTSSDESNDGLLDLLKSKGVITQQEMEQLRRNEAKEKKEDLPSVGYKKGAYIKTQGDKHELHFRFLFQPRFETTDVYNAPTETSFLIRHAQLRMFGHILDPRLKYKMMINGAGRTRAEDVDLRDLWVDWQWTDAFQIKFGQFLVWFDHENLAPTWGLHLVDRSIINANLGFERDPGVQVHGHLFGDRMDYYLSIVNGEGRNEINAGNDLTYIARVDLHLLGKEQYLVADVPMSCDPHLAWGTAYLHDGANRSVGGNRLNRFTTDLVYRYNGFSALGLVNRVQNADTQTADFGYLGEAGYFLLPGRFEVVGRFAEINREGAINATLADPRELTIGVNYYFNEHQVKLQVDYSLLWNDRSVADRDAQRVRFQMQLFF